MNRASSQKRHQAGAPASRGGQYKAENKSTDVGVSLTSTPPADPDEKTALAPLDTSPVPVDTSQGYRKTYSGSEASVTMPSRSLVAQTATENPGRDVDFPVNLVIAGGQRTAPAGYSYRVEDVELAGTARVSQAPTGRWRVSVLDGQGHVIQGDQGHLATEAVASVLEARRARMPFDQIASLREQNSRRRAGDSSGPTSSKSWLTMQYNDETQVLTVSMPGYNKGNGRRRIYGYSGVTPQEAHALVNTRSPGKAYNHLVRQRRPQVQVSECDSCGAVYPTGSLHTCPR